MTAANRPHPVSSLPGALTLASWSLYLLSAALYFLPDIPPSAMVIGFGGLLACLAVAFRFRYWRWVVALASIVHLSFYAVRVGLMLGMTAESGWSSILSTLSFYYGSSWRVTAGLFQERGVVGGLTHGFLEYAMPVLSLALIVITVVSRRNERDVSTVA